MSKFEDLDYKSGFSPNSLYDKDLAEKLLIIFSEYKFFDLCRAIFCINAWRYNRAHLNFYLTLNYTLSICKKSGDKQIKHYEDFVAFFNELKPYFKSYFEDEIVPDFGEIKIAYNNNFYPVFLGTGYNFVFPMMQSLFSLSNSLNIVSEMEEGLIYIKEMVTALSETNRYDGEKDLFILHLPPKDFFQECMAWYTTKDLNGSKVLKLLINTERSKIEETHFIQFNSEIYPLFNPSIIIDLFHILCRNLKLTDSQRLEAMRVTLYNSLSRNFELNPDSHKLFIQVGIIENLEKHKIVGQLLFDFAIIGQDKFLFFINEKSAKDKNIINIKRIADEFIKQKQFKVIEFLGNGKCKIANFSFCKDVEFIVYDSEIELTDVTKLIENGQLASHYAYDLLTILYRAKSVDDIVEFLKFKKKSRAQFLSMSGDSAVFELWITQHKELMPGAIQATLVTTDIYPVEWDVFKEYVELSRWYPFENYSNMFANPCCWIINKEYNNNYLMLVNKAVFGYGGFFRKVDDSYLFLTFNFVFEDLTDKGDSRHEAIRMIEDLNFRNFVLFEDALKSSGMYDVYGVQIMYMPMKYAETVDNTGFLKQNRKYVYSDFCFQEGRLFIRYAVNEEQLLQDILNSTTKSVECDYFLELLSCINNTSNFDFKGLAEKVNERRNDKKDIEAIAVEVKYYYSQNNFGLEIDNEYYVQVRKLIANDCKKANINSGLYSAEDATKIIRELQELIIPRFELNLAKYDKYKLHKKLLSVLAFNIHNKYLNSKRFTMVNKDNISVEAREITSINVIKSREDNKERIREITYLIETNLSVSHRGKEDISSEDLKHLLAFSHWLIILQDNSDSAHYNLDGTKIQIEDDFRVSTVFEDEQIERAKKRQRRVYENIDYRPALQSDSNKFKQAADKFYVDTGVYLQDVFIICEYFYHEFYFTFKDEVNTDVFEVNEKDIKNDIKSWLDKFSEDEIENIFKALDFLILDELKIKTVNGKEEKFVPIWQREGRDCRFDIKPLIRNGDKIIFTPTSFYELSVMWESGIYEFYLPYEYGLSELRKDIMKWKTECEKHMEHDVEKFLQEKGYIARKNLQLHKLDKKFGHPTDLGDYDVLAVDTVNRVIWNLESKFLNKVGSLREYYNHQDSFFIKNKKDEKFSRRIAYLESNVEPILRALGVSDYKNYTVKSYMVTNKVFYPDIKKVEFEIITFYELKQLIGIR